MLWEFASQTYYLSSFIFKPPIVIFMPLSSDARILELLVVRHPL
jgi:hypothetical protein